jgi:hypothetical protein
VGALGKEASCQLAEQTMHDVTAGSAIAEITAQRRDDYAGVHGRAVVFALLMEEVAHMLRLERGDHDRSIAESPR